MDLGPFLEPSTAGRLSFTTRRAGPARVIAAVGGTLFLATLYFMRAAGLHLPALDTVWHSTIPWLVALLCVAVCAFASDRIRTYVVVLTPVAASGIAYAAHELLGLHTSLSVLETVTACFELAGAVATGLLARTVLHLRGD